MPRGWGASNGQNRAKVEAACTALRAELERAKDRERDLLDKLEVDVARRRWLVRACAVVSGCSDWCWRDGRE